MERGAAGVVVERLCPEAGRLQVLVPDAGWHWRGSAMALAGEPAEQLVTIGVTGTCGKTVTSLFLRSIFEATGARFGLVGSLGLVRRRDDAPGGGGRRCPTPRDWPRCSPRWSSAAAWAG